MGAITYINTQNYKINTLLASIKTKKTLILHKKHIVYL